MNLRFFSYVIISLFFISESKSSELVTPIYEDNGRMINHQRVASVAKIIFERKRSGDDERLEAAKQLIEAGRWFTYSGVAQGHRFSLINMLVFCDIEEARNIAREEVLNYMKANVNYWSNNLRCVNRPASLDIYDDEGPLKKFYDYLEFIEFLGIDEAVQGEPRETLIRSLDTTKWNLGRTLENSESLIDDLDFLMECRKGVSEALIKLEDLKSLLSSLKM